jgi:DNA polymerase-1
MQQTGALISRGRWNKWKKRLKENADALRAQMIEVGNLPANFTFAPAEVILLLYGIKSPKHDKAAEWETHKPGSAIRDSKYELHQMVQAIRPLWRNNQYRGRLNDSGVPSLDKNGIAGLRMYASNRIQTLNLMKRRTTEHDVEEAELRRFTKWLDLYAEWKRVEKMEAMFRELPIRADGRLHPSLLIHGTATGRLSCSRPNLQQWNKDEGADEAIREIIVAPEGHYIIAADWDSLEFRVMAYECEDPKMLDIIERGLNQHDENTKALFGIDETHAKWKTYRAAAKTYQFASQYGAGINKLHESLTIRVPEANFTAADVKRMRSNFERTYAGWAAWCTRVQEEAKQTRISSNAFGRKRILYGTDYEVRNQALNNPSQSGAAHIMNDALYRIWRRLHAENLRSRLQISIHDELRFEVPAEELEYVCTLVKEEMEHPISYRERTVVFPVKIEYGRDWHNLQPWGATLC